jgi:hypothetical protein
LAGAVPDLVKERGIKSGQQFHLLLHELILELKEFLR